MCFLLQIAKRKQSYFYSADVWYITGRPTAWIKNIFPAAELFYAHKIHAYKHFCVSNHEIWHAAWTNYHFSKEAVCVCVSVSVSVSVSLSVSECECECECVCVCVCV